MIYIPVTIIKLFSSLPQSLQDIGGNGPYPVFTDVLAGGLNSVLSFILIG